MKLHTLLALLAAALLMLGIATGPATAADRHVPASYPTIAAALGAAASGDRVILAHGTYHEHSLVLRSGVTLLGDPASPRSVVIDAGGAGRVLLAENLGAVVVIRGVTVTGGRAEGANAYAQSGGGLLAHNAEVRLEYCVLIANTAAGNGGGLRVTAGTVHLLRSELRGNVAGKGGGGLELGYGASGYVRHATVVANRAAWGGGVAVRNNSYAAISDSRLTTNRAVSEPGLGGAVACDLDAVVELTRCLLADNEARFGGGVFTATGAAPVLTSVTIDRNATADAGGGLYCNASSPVINWTIISFHNKEAITSVNGASPKLTTCNLYANQGGSWTGPVSSQFAVNRNFSFDPFYCATDQRTLNVGSPCSLEVNGFGLVGAFGIGCDKALDTPDAPLTASLRAQPNPFNPLTEIVYTLPSAGAVKLTVFDVRGQRLAVLVDEVKAPGEHRLRWDARDGSGRALASGAYLAVLDADGRRQTLKLMLMR